MLTRFLIVVAQWCLYALLSANLEPEWSLKRIAFEGPGLLPILVVLMLLAGTAWLLPSAVKRPSEVALWLLTTFVVVPTLTVSAVNPAFTEEVRTFTAAVIWGGFVLVAILVRSFPPRFRIPEPGFRLSRSGFIQVVVILTLLSMATIILGYGVSQLDLSWADQYDRRLAIRETAPPFPGAQYLKAWLASPLISILLIVGIQWRRWLLLVLVPVGALMVFALDGQKSALAIPVLALVILLSVRTARSGSRGPWLGGCLTLLLSIPMMLTWLWPDSQADYAITRRLGLVPGVLSHYYVEYAFRQGVDGIGSVFTAFTSSGTPLGPLVGNYISAGRQENASVNPWADAYGTGGTLAVIIVCVLLALVLRLMDRLAATRDAVVATAVLGSVCFWFVNGALASSVITGGVVVTLLLVFFMPSGAADSTEGPVETDAQGSAPTPVQAAAGSQQGGAGFAPGHSHGRQSARSSPDTA